MAHALSTAAAAATVVCPSHIAALSGSCRRTPSTRVRLVSVRAEAPAVSPISAAPTTLKIPDVAPLKTSTAADAAAPASDTPTATYPYASLPPTPVFPSHAAMALFLQSYARMLQHVKTAATAVDFADHSHDALVSGDSLAAVGATVVERVRLGLGALLHHPRHGVAGGERWCAQEARAELCLAELERDIECIRSAHERPPRAAAVALASIHCLDAARVIRTL